MKSFFFLFRKNLPHQPHRPVMKSQIPPYRKTFPVVTFRVKGYNIRICIKMNLLVRVFGSLVTEK